MLVDRGKVGPLVSISFTKEEHLVDDCSFMLREEWNVKIEESDTEGRSQIKQEHQEYYWLEPTYQQSSSTGNIEVSIREKT